LTEYETREANRLAADPNSTEDDCYKMLAQLEHAASDAHGYWEQTL
jgi:hypothetical protein